MEIRLTFILHIFTAVTHFITDATFAESDIIEIEVKLNGEAILPCNVTPIVNDKITLVIWYKNESSPVYSVDMRGIETADYAEHWSDDHALGGRSKFNFDKRSLIIEHVKRTDEGYYKCRVDYKRTPTRNCQIYLVVAVPVESVSILEAVPTTISEGSVSEENTSLLLPPLTVGSTLTVTCLSVGGNPLPKVIWKYKNEILDAVYENFPERNEVKNILWIESIQRNHLDKIITCIAENSKLFNPISVSALITLNLPPEQVQILGQKKPLSAGQQYEMSCQVKGSRPAANITWRKDNKILHGQSRYSISEDKSTSVSLLSFTPKAKDTGKVLTCEAFSPNLIGTKISDSLPLVVNYAPIVSLSLGKTLNSSSIKEGTDVYFDCFVRAMPSAHKVQFLHNNTTVLSSSNEGVIISNQTLVLQSVRRDKAGSYVCRATNTEGVTNSESIYLDIKFEPVCQQNQQLVYGVSRNEVINVTCNVDSNPPADWFRWSFNNSMIHLKPLSNNFTVSNGSSVIAYKPSSELQYGTLLCSAKNELGPQVVPCVFHIVSAGNPDSPHNCSIENKTQNSIHVKCLKGFDGGLPQEFICEIRSEKDNKMISNVTSQLSPEFLVNGLEPRTGYRIIIYSTNVKGRSKNSIHLNVTTLPTSSHQHRRIDFPDKSSFTWDISLKITIGCAVAALLILISIAYWSFKLLSKRSHRRRSERQFFSSDTAVQLSKCEPFSLASFPYGSSEEDNNPDLIPQNTISLNTTSGSYPLINSISVQTSEYDLDSISTCWSTNKQSQFIPKSAPKLLEANKLEELVGWSPNCWSAAGEPIMLVIPETITATTVSKQNAETQTSLSPQNRKESAV